MAKTRNRMYEPYGYREGEQYFSLRNTIDNEIIYNRRTDKEQDVDIDTLSGDVKDIQDTLGTITSGGTYETIDARITENRNDIENIYSTAFFNASYNTNTESLDFKNNDGDVTISVPMTDIIAHDLIKSAIYDKESQQIIITFDNGDIVYVDCADLIDIDEYGIGLELVDDRILAVKKDETSEQVIVDSAGTLADVLTISTDGVKIANIQTAIDVEKERAMAAEAEEAATRKSADDSLQGQINSEVATRTSEVARLDGRIDQETNDRQTQDTALNTKLGNEQTAREARDTYLEDLIIQKASDSSAAVAAERDRAMAEEARLWRAIDGSSGSTSGLLERVVALENKMATFEGAIKINPGLSPDDTPQSVYMYVEGEWHDVTTLLSAFTNEGF